MSVDCQNCGSDEFRDMKYNYYGMTWRFTCANCGDTLVLKEAGD